MEEIVPFHFNAFFHIRKEEIGKRSKKATSFISFAIRAKYKLQMRAECGIFILYKSVHGDFPKNDGKGM